MYIASRTHRLIATSLLFVGLTTGLSHAQTASVIVVDGVTCNAAHAVSVSFNGGALNINTGGCGTAVVLPPTTSPPLITGLSLSNGASGSAVTINGANMAGARVTIGGAAANIISNSGTQIFTTVPSSAIVGLGSIVVTTNVAPAASFAFTVASPPPAAAPVITLLSPTSGQVGTPVTITGTGLTGATVTIGGVAATVVTGSATSITTTVPASAPVTSGNLVVTAGGGSVSSAFTVTAAVVGAEMSIDGITLPNPSKYGFATPPFRNGIKGAGPEINAYAMDPARCKTSPALTRSWQHNISLDNYKLTNAFDFFAMSTGESLSYKFTVGNVDVSGGFLYLDAAASGGDVRPTFMSITSAPCDFDLSKLRPENRDACYQTAISSANINWANITGPMPSSMCRLVKGQTYYLNLRFQDGRTAGERGSNANSAPDSCDGGRLCGGLLQVL